MYQKSEETIIKYYFSSSTYTSKKDTGAPDFPDLNRNRYSTYGTPVYYWYIVIPIYPVAPGFMIFDRAG